jgi:hypothetical protein
MKKKLLLLWLLLPVPIIALHYGPGQRLMARDEAETLADRAEAAAAGGEHVQAAALFREAAQRVGASEPEAQLRLHVAAARARAQGGDAAEALDALDQLLADPRIEQHAGVGEEARELAARTAYHASWVMRLEGATRDEWLPVAEESRQQYRLLAEAGGGATAESARQNVEAAVRLQRMSLAELMAKPLPKDCQGMCNKNLKEKMCKRCDGKKGNCKKPGKKPSEDLRENKGAGLGERMEGAGS